MTVPRPESLATDRHGRRAPDHTKHRGQAQNCGGADDHLRSVLSARVVSQQNGNNLQKLVNIMRTLRAPDGCPWDRAQTL